MKLVKAVKESDIALNGVTVSLQTVDGKIEAVVVTDVDGKYIRIVKDGAYSENLKVLIQEPVEYANVYKLTVKIDDGVSVYKLDSKEKVERKVQSLHLNEGEYTIEEIEVVVQKNLQGCKEEINFDSIPF